MKCASCCVCCVCVSQQILERAAIPAPIPRPSECLTDELRNGKEVEDLRRRRVAAGSTYDRVHWP